MTTTDMPSPYGSILGDKAFKPSKADAFSMKGRVVWGVIFALTLIVGIGGWSVTAMLSGAIIGAGTVLVDEDLKAVQHLDGGVVRDIAVRKGDIVAAGDTLIRLDDVQIRAEQSIISGQLAELLVRQIRLMAERDGLDAVAFPPSLLATYQGAAAIAGGEQQLFAGNLADRQSKQQQLELQSDQLHQEIAGLQAQKAAVAEELTLAADEQTRFAALVEQGLMEETRLNALTRDLARLQGQLGGIEANLARSQMQIGEIDLQITDINQGAQNLAQRELRDVEARIAELVERLRAAQERLDRTVIRAPVAGVINELNVSTLGGVITPAERLVTIVPTGADLRIEFRVAPRDIDQVAIGQPTKMRFSAFNQRTTPELEGVISRVAAAAQRDPQTGESYYLAQAEITDDLGALGGRGLVPGMPVEVFVQTEEQPAIVFFTKPFLDQINRTFREE